MLKNQDFYVIMLLDTIILVLNKKNKMSINAVLDYFIFSLCWVSWYPSSRHSGLRGYQSPYGEMSEIPPRTWRQGFKQREAQEGEKVVAQQNMFHVDLWMYN